MIELFEKYKLNDIITAYIISGIAVGLIRSFVKGAAGEDVNPAQEIADAFLGSVLVAVGSLVALTYLQSRHKS